MFTAFPIIVTVFVIFILNRMIRIVPNQKVFVIETLGKYSRSLSAGLHFLIPIVDRVAYKHTLKEMAVDVPPQVCITKDNISVEIDGVLYIKVIDPIKASYGIQNYRFAIIQLAQTMMRSEIGKLDLDITFESRENINAAIVQAIDEASDPWGIKVTRYEIKNIEPPQSIRDAMEKQMRAEREKREKIALSEGDRQAKINRAEGERAEAIKISEGEKERLANEAEGKAQAILAVARATSEGIREIAKAINEPGGKNAVEMQIAQEWIQQFGNLAKKNNSMIIPSNVADITSIASVMKNALNFTQENKKEN
ncbi:MAG: paraslipin [Candidatus Cloacimonadota bacterium]|nr:MAG: paraslipin [Candidatus Cloacimonadota bacterium]